MCPGSRSPSRRASAISAAASTSGHPRSNIVTMLDEARSTSTTTHTDRAVSNACPGKSATSIVTGEGAPFLVCSLKAGILCRQGGLDTKKHPQENAPAATGHTPAGVTSPVFPEKLRAAQRLNNSFLCIGLDPDPALMAHPHVPSFFTEIIEETKDLVCAYKPNLAFFEALGMQGMQIMLESLCARPQAHPDHRRRQARRHRQHRALLRESALRRLQVRRLHRQRLRRPRSRRAVHRKPRAFRLRLVPQLQRRRGRPAGPGIRRRPSRLRGRRRACARLEHARQRRPGRRRHLARADRTRPRGLPRAGDPRPRRRRPAGRPGSGRRRRDGRASAAASSSTPPAASPTPPVATTTRPPRARKRSACATGSTSCGKPPLPEGSAVVMDVRLGDVVRLRKTHPCGSTDWEVVRLGADIGIVCRGCKRRVLLDRSTFEKRVKTFISRGPGAHGGCGGIGPTRATSAPSCARAPSCRTRGSPRCGLPRASPRPRRTPSSSRSSSSSSRSPAPPSTPAS